MKIWLDVHIPPALAPWLKSNYGVAAKAFRDEGLTRTSDRVIFTKLRKKGEVVMTKDADFVALVEAKGPPPQVIWITCGNTSNKNLQRVLEKTLPEALKLLKRGEPVVEIRDS